MIPVAVVAWVALTLALAATALGTTILTRLIVLERSRPAECRVCGCTDAEACAPFGCYWVETDLCSACVGAEA